MAVVHTTAELKLTHAYYKFLSYAAIYSCRVVLRHNEVMSTFLAYGETPGKIVGDRRASFKQFVLAAVFHSSGF